MSLSPGSRLGVHEVVAKIGAGGMGEVYRAKDTKLNRDVALKILPASFAGDKDRVARFLREAQVLASLNHPHIAGIYGFEDSGDTQALAMEFVNGEDLSAVIARGPIALGDALPMARQIADALESAHEQGIIHRDLKPQNIKVTPDGTVKVLDFGLAKAVAADGSASSVEAMNSPTLTVRATQMGMILGTAAYMAPEQAKGRPVDRRADIWAFGAVLFEMLAGRRAFEGDDVSEVLASVLKLDADWSALPADLPEAVRRFLKRCLEKDPKKRLRNLAEGMLQLEDALAMPIAISATTSGTVTAAVPPTPLWRRAMPIGLAVVVTAATIIGINYWRAVPPTPRTPVRFAYDTGKAVTFRLITQRGVAISPDGNTIIFTASSELGGLADLWVRRLDQLEATPLRGAAGASSPVVSPDSAWVAFTELASNSTLTKVSILGGATTVVCRMPEVTSAWHGRAMGPS